MRENPIDIQNRQTLNKIERWCHDAAIQYRTAAKCGKHLPNLVDIAQLFERTEELARIVRQNMGSI